MNRFIFFLAIWVSALAASQNINRIEISGKIIVEGSDLAGITVFNASSNTGTVTDSTGSFLLKVALNDQIEVSALQYQNISFKINEDIIESKKMKLFLIEEINRLDEVVVITKGLTGNLDADIKQTQPFKPKLDALYFGIKHSDEYDFERDNKTAVENIAMNTEGVTVVNGLNVVNVVGQLLLPLFRAKAPKERETMVPEVKLEDVKYYFGSEFLIDNFGIPEHRVEGFIDYVQDGDFDFSLLNYGKEMEFLELLNQKSKEFLEKQN